MFSSDLSSITNPLNSLLEEKREEFDYNALYRAYVISIDDPKEMGRVQVRIPSLHGVVNDSGMSFVQDNALPWAFPGIFAGGGNQIGSVLLPEVGGIVYVGFEYADEGETRDIVYFGGLMTLKSTTVEKTIVPQRNVNAGDPYIVEENDLPTEVRDNKAIKMIYKSMKGSKIYIDDSDGLESVYLVDATGQKIKLGNDAQPYKNVTDRKPSEKARETAYINIEHDERNYIKIDNGTIDIVSPRVLVNHRPIGSGGGVSSYNDLEDLPSINNIEFIGNRNLAETPLSNMEIENLLN